MTTNPTLADRVERAEGASRELDAVIAVAVSGDARAYVVQAQEGDIFDYKPGWWVTGDGKSARAPAYTAGMTEAELLLLKGWKWQAGWSGDRDPQPGDRPAFALLIDERNNLIGDLSEAATPALALCAAALRARQETPDGEAVAAILKEPTR